MWWLSDGFMLLFNLVAFSSAFLFLFIVTRYRTCRNLSTILVANTCCAGLVATGSGISQAISMLFGLCYYSDLCAVASYFFTVGSGAVLHSLCLQALHRLFSNVLKNGIGNHRIVRSSWFYPILIIVQWGFSIAYSLPIYKSVIFIPGSCLCQLSLADVPSFLDALLCVYLIPFSFIFTIYIIILRFHRIHTQTTIRQNISQQQKIHRETIMFKRILIPLGILFLTGFPFLIFFLHAQFITPPLGYAQRVAALIVAVGWSAIMIFNIMVTNCVKNKIVDIIPCRRKRQIECITMQITRNRTRVLD